MLRRVDIPFPAASAPLRLGEGLRRLMAPAAALLVALLLPAFALPQPKADPSARAAAAFYDGIQIHQLPNGLRVFFKPIPESPLVTVMTGYRVGSADEELDQTGLSHYLEHLMFKGTDQLMPGDIDKKTRRAGGQNNAYTTPDFTNYHFDLPADKWETALAIEADRMRNLRIDAKHEFEQEKGAVISELDGLEDEPWDLEDKAILPLLFGEKSPYGHPIIGDKAHVRAATAQIIQAHYDKWYHPNNALIVMVGGFDPAKALARIKQLFGPIPATKLPDRKTAAPIRRTSPVYKEFPSKFDVDRLLIGFNTVRMGEPEDYVLDVIEGILSSGKTGRLYRRLVIEQEVAAEVLCTNLAGRLPGWFSIQLEVLRGVDHKKAERALLSELQILAREPVDDAEIRRVKKSILATFIFAHEGVHDLADSIINTAAMDDLSYVQTYFSKLEAVSAKDVQEVARRLLDPEKRVVVCSRATDSADRSALARPQSRLPSKHHALPAFRKFRPKREPAANVAAQSVDLRKVRREILPNGLTLLLWEDHRLPIVFAEALVKNTRLHEANEEAGVAALVGLTLDEGTKTRSERDISFSIENVGGALEMSSSGGSVKVLTPDTALGIDLLFDCLIRPQFPRKAVTRWREHLLSEIEAIALSAQSRSEERFHAGIYGKHPLGRSSYGVADVVEGLGTADCRAFHRRVFVPNNTIVVVAGDIEPAKIIADIQKLTAEWKTAALPKLTLPQIARPERFQQELVSIPMSAQVNVNLGHVGVRRNDPDYHTLLVLDNILGVGSGFTDRLSSNLRDRHGLAYQVTASITDTAGEEPGVFRAYVGTYADKFLDVKSMLLDEIRKFREQGPTDEEVADARNYLINSFAFRLATLADIGGELITLERHALGFDYQERYRREVAQATTAGVLAAAKKHLDPDRMTLVAAGAIDQKGRPLQKP